MSITRSAGIACLLLFSPALCLSAHAGGASGGFKCSHVNNYKYDKTAGYYINSQIKEHDCTVPEGSYEIVYGAYAEDEHVATAEANDNTLRLVGSFDAAMITGAVTQAGVPDSSNLLSATSNGNTIKVGSDAGDAIHSSMLTVGSFSQITTREEEAASRDITVTASLSSNNNKLDIYGGTHGAAVAAAVMMQINDEHYDVDTDKSVISADNNTLTLHGGTYGSDEKEDNITSIFAVTAGVVHQVLFDTHEYKNASAANNTLVLTYGPDGSAPQFADGLILAGGLFSTDKDGENYTVTKYTTGHTLKILETKGMTAGNIKGFNNLEFQLPDMNANETLLTLTDTAGTSIDGATVAVTKVANLYGANGGEFKNGDKVYLLKNENGLTTTNLTKKEVTGQTGVSLNYVLSIEEDENSLYLVRTGGTSNTNEGTKAIAEGAAAGGALINAGADAVISAVGSLGSFGGFQHASYSSAGSNGRASADEETYGNIFAFGYAQGSSLRHETGSSVNVSSVSLLAGLGSGFNTGAGKLAVGAFFEYGKGSYTTNNSFDSRADIDGDGNAWYMGGGIMARMNFVPTGPGHFYVEGSAHMGTLHNEYDSNDLTDANGNVAKFDMDSPYYSLHGGLGYIWNFAEGHDLDVYGKYIWSRVQGTDDTLTTTDKFEYDDMDSNRIRLGARYTYTGSERFIPYVGAAFEHEFSGSCDSRAFGHPVAAPSFEGSSGMGELGLIMKPAESLPLSINLGVQGYVGQKQGISGNCLISYEF
ncbi:MAG: autotransporter outer membrane beta-barrel domain-containing protein [Desulfovibrionaceae bacterium]|nr:autotransporter outer membrane beta-barrel domain-containing protein [Desulfovibrionaceae bacterium]